VALTTLDGSRKETAHVAPRFLPDGRRFLFTALPGNVVFLASLDAPDRTRLVDADSAVSYALPGYLLFTRAGTLMAQGFDPSRGALRGDPVPVTEGVATVNPPGSATRGLFSASDTGVLAYQPSAQALAGTPVWVDRNGRELGPVGNGIREATNPRLSPDGQRLAVVIDGDIWVHDLQGRPAIKLTFDGKQSAHLSPLWSPDGRRLVFETQSPAPLRSVLADGSSSGAEVVSPPGHFHPHGWSGNPAELLAVRIGNPLSGGDIVTFPLGETSKPRGIVDTPASEGNFGAALSPDGRWLAYAANPTDSLEIWVRPYPGPGAPVRISQNGGSEPVWARHGRELYLYYREEDKVMAATIQPGSEFRFAEPVKLFEGAYVRGTQPPTYDVASDGRFLMLKTTSSAEPGTQPLTIIVNWADELRRRLGAP